MIPDNELSSSAVISGFSFPVKEPGDELVDWELAGVYLNDPSQGLAVKLWRVDAVRNNDSGLIDVVLTAPGEVEPGVPSVVLFSGADITEVALTFDQNMNPFVAYQQGADAKLYWYDPTVPGMTHTTLPAGIRTMRCTLDDKRGVATSGSDIVLSYVRAGNLCVRYQRERFTVEYVLRAGVGADAQLVSMAMNNGARLQWRMRNYALTSDPGALLRVDPTLADVVSGICRTSGVPAENIDVSELWHDTVPGLRIQTEKGLDKAIDVLREIYLFDKSQHDRKLFWPKRGRPVVARIPYKHLIYKAPSSLEMKFKDEQELPRSVHINHIDPDGGFAKNKQSASRRSNMVYTKEEEKIEADVILTADQAATAALRILKQRWGEQISYEFSTTIRYTNLTNGDVVEVEDAKGIWHRIRIEDRDEDKGIIDWTGEQDAGARAYETQHVGNSLPPPTSTTPGIISETRLDVVNVSPQRDQDDELGLYIAAAGEGGAWTGYTLYYSTDGGVTYIEAYTSQVPSIIGETFTDLLEESDPARRSSQTVEVVVNFPLSSISYTQLMGKQNRIIIGDEELQFQTATLLGMVGTQYHYRLSNLLRGRFSTAIEHWPSGARFILLDESVVFVQLQRSYLGQDITYKAVSIGHTTDDATPLDYLFDVAHSQTEWPVADVRAVRAGGDVMVTWIGRARLGMDTAPYHSKYFRGYRVKFSNGHTIDTQDLTATYASAPGGVTVQVCALNEITGEGPYSPAIAT